MQQAQARVADSAHVAVDRQVGPALQDHLERSAGASQVVHEVCMRLEERAAENASSVVSRLAGEAAVTAAIETHCMSRIDERTKGIFLWSVIVPFISAGAAVYVSRWWDNRKK